MAINTCSYDVAKFLIEKRAKVNVKNKVHRFHHDINIVCIKF